MKLIYEKNNYTYTVVPWGKLQLLHCSSICKYITHLVNIATYVSSFAIYAYTPVNICPWAMQNRVVGKYSSCFCTLSVFSAPLSLIKIIPNQASEPYTRIIQQNRETCDVSVMGKRRRVPWREQHWSSWFAPKLTLDINAEGKIYLTFFSA